MRLSLGDIAAIVDGDLIGVDAADLWVEDVVIDSRKARTGSLFVALVGEHVDGHDYVPAVLGIGGAAAIVARSEAITVGPAIAVDDVEEALGQLAREWLRRLRATQELTVVAVTGSVGKTTTKDLLAQVLGRAAMTVAPVGSFNNEIGLPLTVLRADADTRYLVLEMGASGPGHIAYLTTIARPDVSIVLCVGSAHMAGFGDIDGTARAKAEIVAALAPEGIAVLNSDDARVRGMSSMVPGGLDRTVLFGSQAADAAVAAHDIRLDVVARPTFTLTIGTAQVRVEVPLSGEHQVSNALAVAAACHALGFTAEWIAESLTQARPLSRYRMEVHSRTDGVTVVNDAYNANPESMRAALRSLSAMGDARGLPARTWAVLGEMLELGRDADRDHFDLGVFAANLGISRVVAIGSAAAAVARGARSVENWTGEALNVDSIEDARLVLSDALGAGDIVLVKSSNGARLYQLGEWLVGPDPATVGSTATTGENGPQ